MVEAIRARYRPEQITTLFVGESAPHSGDFFYTGNTLMLRYMKQAVEDVLGAGDDFLTTFKGYGWYLDDLVLDPVNHLTEPERKAACVKAQSSLAARIEQYRPRAIVCLLRRIDGVVRGAMTTAGSDAVWYAVPFPGMGTQVKFHIAMQKIAPGLPRLEAR